MSPTDDEGGILEVYCSGFSYQIMDGVTPSITSTLKNGVIYTVAMGDYLCSNFIFPQRGNGKPTGIDVRKALIDYLKQIKKLLNPPPSKLPIISPCNACSSPEAPECYKYWEAEPKEN